MINFGDHNFVLYKGDALDVISRLGNNTIDCVCTSYPQDLSPGYLAALFTELNRVRKPEGILWINCNEEHKEIEDSGQSVINAMYWIIKASCPEGGVILDPFMGTGATGVMALGMKRRFIGVDKNAQAIRHMHDFMSGVTKKEENLIYVP